MKIVIAGLGKSGTTALFFKIKNSLPFEPRCIFEPTEYKEEPEDREKGVFAKVLLKDPDRENYDSFGEFDRKILIVRDPRDRLISNILYKVWDGFYADERKVKKFIALLEKKERDPKSVSVLRVLALLKKLERHDFWKSPRPGKFRKKKKSTDFWLDTMYGRRFHRAAEFYEKHPGYFCIKYEDFISGNIEGLEKYLGIRLRGSASVSKEYSRVVRTKKSGGWRNWFLEEDIRFFRSL